MQHCSVLLKPLKDDSDRLAFLRHELVSERLVISSRDSNAATGISHWDIGAAMSPWGSRTRTDTDNDVRME